jgi:pentatricopeptide repeat protein
MKFTEFEWNAVISMLCTVKNAKEAKALFEMWLDENYYEKIYKQAWLDCCDEYDIDDTYYCDDEDAI